MKKLLLLSFVLSSLIISAQHPDTINVYSHQKVQLTNYGAYNGWGVFPPDTGSYRKIWLDFTLGCATGHCSAWDYTVNIYIRKDTHINDSAWDHAPTFTLNNAIVDSALTKKDTSYKTFYDTATHLTDSTANKAETIIQYKNCSKPTTPTDTLYRWLAGYYNLYYDSAGHVVDSLYVSPDSTLYVSYCYYWYVYDSIAYFEIARLITPYAGDYQKSSWTFPYRFDVTDFASLLHDSVQIQVFYSGYTEGYAATCDFQLITGTPPHNAYYVKNLWTGTFPYGSASNPISNYLKPVPQKIDANAKAVRLLIYQTGHGEDGNNCEEFCGDTQYVYINRVKRFTTFVWRPTCGLNPQFPQAGTWIYNRANWCPGALVYPYLDDLSPYITPGKTDTIDITCDYYLSPNGGSVYTFGTSLIYYGPINYSLDASLEDIVSPTTDSAYRRLNPDCAGPRVIIRNTGATAIDSVDITYGAIGGITNTYHWKGNLAFNDTALVLLTPISLTTQTSPLRFQATLSNPNGGVDQNPDNNTLIVPFDSVPVYPSNFIIRLRTNGEGSEFSYFISDANGNIVLNKSGFGNSQLYADTVNLPVGCYHFELDASNEDGLYFLGFNSENPGSIQFFKIKPTNLIATLQSNFGTSITQDFKVNVYTGINAVDKMDPDYDVYPNPAKDVLTISGLNSSHKDKELRIYSSLGSLIYDGTIAAGTGLFNLNLAGEASGIYCIIISNSDGQYVKKLIIEK